MCFRIQQNKVAVRDGLSGRHQKVCIHLVCHVAQCKVVICGPTGTEFESLFRSL